MKTQRGFPEVRTRIRISGIIRLYNRQTIKQTQSAPPNL